jgi:hypothetical protein
MLRAESVVLLLEAESHYAAHTGRMGAHGLGLATINRYARAARSLTEADARSFD